MKTVNDQNQSQYQLNAEGEFVIRNYNQSKPFSNFFPGIAGTWGTPLWVFYVNRGQGISSFGIESKDRAILEFLPANKAYRMTSLQGFRTFIKVMSAGKVVHWEPFTSDSQATMTVRSHDLTLRDESRTLGLSMEVNYFTLPNEEFPALVRRVKLTNSAKQSRRLQVVDGLPMITAYGMKDWVLKNMSRTVEAWVKVKNVKAKAPFYHLNVEVADTPDVVHIKQGNFFFSFAQQGQKVNLLDPIIEAAVVFGASTDFIQPQAFWAAKSFQLPTRQEFSNRTPSAMALTNITLAPGQSYEFTSVIGHTFSEEHLKQVVKRVTAPGYITAKAQENKTLVESVKHYALTVSSSSAFDHYCGQTFLDNILRGGLPVTVNTSDGKMAFNVFSRKHGDPERDYNYFVLSPTYFSQGNGNFRDVNQNRRNDVWFNPYVKDSSIIDFFNLSQADGYNPLVVKGMSFSISDPEHIEALLGDSIKGEYEALRKLLQKSFQPGEVFKCILEQNIQLKISAEDFLQKLLSHCQRQILADHGEGFWSDHWTYNLDLVESYLGVYPEHLKSLLLERKCFSFYHNAHYLVARTDRYVLTDKGVRQYHGVVDGSKEIPANARGNKLRVNGGDGEVYHTNLLIKMLCLAANKVSCLDPSGIGIEMEGDKPNWYDALNGLPGLLGSSISETFELQRICQFNLSALDQLKITQGRYDVFVELADFMKELKGAMDSQKDPAGFWHKANDAKEHYRQKIRNGIQGQEVSLEVSAIRDFLKAIVDRCRQGVGRARLSNGLIPTYFYHEVTDFAKLDKKHHQFVHVLPIAFKRHDLPLFLEGIVHDLKVHRDFQQAQNVYKAVRTTGLFDRKLKMYRVNDNISSETEEIGRTRIFPRGWLENESIWLHMQYKYFLEILRCGLNKEFFQTMQEALIPFLKPEIYGRSILENSSFIASSSHEDVALHGQGFVARLSGSTAEFLHMWLWMNAGPTPFQWDRENDLTLKFKPSLPAWLFTTHDRDVSFVNQNGERVQLKIARNRYAFQFLSSTLVIYHNPKRLDTFGSKAAKILKMVLSYPDSSNTVEIKGDTLPARYALEVREKKVSRIEVELG